MALQPDTSSPLQHSQAVGTTVGALPSPNSASTGIAIRQTLPAPAQALNSQNIGVNGNKGHVESVNNVQGTTIASASQNAVHGQGGQLPGVSTLGMPMGMGVPQGQEVMTQTSVNFPRQPGSMIRSRGPIPANTMHSAQNQGHSMRSARPHAIRGPIYEGGGGTNQIVEYNTTGQYVQKPQNTYGKQYIGNNFNVPEGDGYGPVYSNYGNMQQHPVANRMPHGAMQMPQPQIVPQHNMMPPNHFPQNTRPIQQQQYWSEDSPMNYMHSRGPNMGPMMPPQQHIENMHGHDPHAVNGMPHQPHMNHQGMHNQHQGMPSDFGQYRQQHGGMMQPNMMMPGQNRVMYQMSHPPHGIMQHAVPHRQARQQYPSSVTMKAPLLSQALGHRHPTSYQQQFVPPPQTVQHAVVPDNNAPTGLMPDLNEQIVSALPPINPLEEDSETTTGADPGGGLPVAHVPPWPAIGEAFSSTAQRASSQGAVFSTTNFTTATQSAVSYGALNNNSASQTVQKGLISSQSCVTLNITSTALLTSNAGKMTSDVSITYSSTAAPLLSVSSSDSVVHHNEMTSRTTADAINSVSLTQNLEVLKTVHQPANLPNSVADPVGGGASVSTTVPSAHTGSACTTTTNSANNVVMSHTVHNNAHGVTSTNVITVSVPPSWKRVVEAGVVVYYSPSKTRLSSCAEIRQYLQTDGTCKCGLHCPLIVEKTFNFDPQVASRPWNCSDFKSTDDLTKLCNHKRKLSAMAALQDTTSLTRINTSLKSKTRKGSKGKRRRSSGLGIDNFDDILSDTTNMDSFDIPDVSYDLDKNSASKLLMTQASRNQKVIPGFGTFGDDDSDGDLEFDDKEAIRHILESEAKTDLLLPSHPTMPLPNSTIHQPAMQRYELNNSEEHMKQYTQRHSAGGSMLPPVASISSATQPLPDVSGFMEPPRPPTKKRQPKRRKKGQPAINCSNTVLSMSVGGMACPNVDVRHMGAPDLTKGSYVEGSNMYVQNMGRQFSPRDTVSPSNSSGSSHGPVSPLKLPEQHSPGMQASPGSFQPNQYSPSGSIVSHSPYGMQHPQQQHSPMPSYHPQQVGYNGPVVGPGHPGSQPSQLSPGSHRFASGNPHVPMSMTSTGTAMQKGGANLGQWNNNGVHGGAISTVGGVNVDIGGGVGRDLEQAVCDIVGTAQSNMPGKDMFCDKSSVSSIHSRNFNGGGYNRSRPNTPSSHIASSTSDYDPYNFDAATSHESPNINLHGGVTKFCNSVQRQNISLPTHQKVTVHDKSCSVENSLEQVLDNILPSTRLGNSKRKTTPPLMQPPPALPEFNLASVVADVKPNVDNVLIETQENIITKAQRRSPSTSQKPILAQKQLCSTDKLQIKEDKAPTSMPNVENPIKMMENMVSASDPKQIALEAAAKVAISVSNQEMERVKHKNKQRLMQVDTNDQKHVTTGATSQPQSVLAHDTGETQSHAHVDKQEIESCVTFDDKPTPSEISLAIAEELSTEVGAINTVSNDICPSSDSIPGTTHDMAIDKAIVHTSTTSMEATSPASEQVPEKLSDPLLNTLEDSSDGKEVEVTNKNGSSKSSSSKEEACPNQSPNESMDAKLLTSEENLESELGENIIDIKSIAKTESVIEEASSNNVIENSVDASESDMPSENDSLVCDKESEKKSFNISQDQDLLVPNPNIDDESTQDLDDFENSAKYKSNCSLSPKEDISMEKDNISLENENSAKLTTEDVAVDTNKSAADSETIQASSDTDLKASKVMNDFDPQKTLVVCSTPGEEKKDQSQVVLKADSVVNKDMPSEDNLKGNTANVAAGDLQESCKEAEKVTLIGTTDLPDAELGKSDAKEFVSEDIPIPTVDKPVMKTMSIECAAGSEKSEHNSSKTADKKAEECIHLLPASGKPSNEKKAEECIHPLPASGKPLNEKKAEECIHPLPASGKPSNEKKAECIHPLPASGKPSNEKKSEECIHPLPASGKPSNEKKAEECIHSPPASEKPSNEESKSGSSSVKEQNLEVQPSTEKNQCLSNPEKVITVAKTSSPGTKHHISEKEIYAEEINKITKRKNNMLEKKTATLPKAKKNTEVTKSTPYKSGTVPEKRKCDSGKAGSTMGGKRRRLSESLYDGKNGSEHSKHSRDDTSGRKSADHSAMNEDNCETSAMDPNEMMLHMMSEYGNTGMLMLAAQGSEELTADQQLAVAQQQVMLQQMMSAGMMGNPMYTAATGMHDLQNAAAAAAGISDLQAIAAHMLAQQGSQELTPEQVTQLQQLQQMQQVQLQLYNSAGLSGGGTSGDGAAGAGVPAGGIGSSGGGSVSANTGCSSGAVVSSAGESGRGRGGRKRRGRGRQRKTNNNATPTIADMLQDPMNAATQPFLMLPHAGMLYNPASMAALMNPQQMLYLTAMMPTAGGCVGAGGGVGAGSSTSPASLNPLMAGDQSVMSLENLAALGVLQVPVEASSEAVGDAAPPTHLSGPTTPTRSTPSSPRTKSTNPTGGNNKSTGKKSASHRSTTSPTGGKSTPKPSPAKSSLTKSSSSSKSSSHHQKSPNVPPVLPTSSVHSLSTPSPLVSTTLSPLGTGTMANHRISTATTTSCSTASHNSPTHAASAHSKDRAEKPGEALDLSTTSNSSSLQQESVPEDLSTDAICSAVINAANVGAPVLITNENMSSSKTTASSDNKSTAKHIRSAAVSSKKAVTPTKSTVEGGTSQEQRTASLSPGALGGRRQSSPMAKSDSIDSAGEGLDEKDEAFRKETREFIKKQLSINSTKAPNKIPTSIASSIASANKTVLAVTDHNQIPNTSVADIDGIASPNKTVSCLPKPNRKKIMSQCGSKLERITATLKFKKQEKSEKKAAEQLLLKQAEEAKEKSISNNPKSKPLEKTSNVGGCSDTGNIDDGDKTDVDSEATDVGIPSDVDNCTSDVYLSAPTAVNTVKSGSSGIVMHKPNGLIDPPLTETTVLHGSCKRKKSASINAFKIHRNKRQKNSDDGNTAEESPTSTGSTFQVGDLVWGPAHGSTMWPGKLVPKDKVKGSPKEEPGKLFIWWFGDHTYSQVTPETLKTLTEGLEAHHEERQKIRKGRKMNSALEAAIQEAMLELDQQMTEQSKGSKPLANSEPKSDNTEATNHLENEKLSNMGCQKDGSVKSTCDSISSKRAHNDTSAENVCETTGATIGKAACTPKKSTATLSSATTPAKAAATGTKSTATPAKSTTTPTKSNTPAKQSATPNKSTSNKAVASSSTAPTVSEASPAVSTSLARGIKIDTTMLAKEADSEPSLNISPKSRKRLKAK